MRPSGVPRRLLAAVALVSAVVVGAWLAAPDDSPSSGDPSSAPSVDAVVAPALAASASLPAATRAGGRVEGVVLRGRAPVVANVDAILRDGDARPSANVVRRTRVRSGPDGAFVLASLPVGEHRIVAQADDGTRADLAVSIPSDGAIVRRTLFLRPTHTLEGRAQYRDGRPFRGTLAVAPPSVGRERYYSALDDLDGLDERDNLQGLDWLRVADDGAFVVGGRPPGSTVVWFREDGGRTRRLTSPHLPRSTEAQGWTVVLDAFDVAVTGSVVDDETGAPIAHATLTVTGGEVVDHVTSDADGKFLARVTGNERVTVYAAARGYAPAESWIDPDAPEITPLAVRLRRGATLTGTVRRRRDGTPVRGALVRLEARGERTALLPSLATTTDPFGRYRWEDLPSIDVSVEASAPGLAPPWHAADRANWSPTSVTLEVGRSVSADVALEESVALVGRVVAYDGALVAGAMVRAVQSTLGMRRTEVVSTDERGSFVLLGAPIGADVELRATAPDGTHGESNVLRVSAGVGPVEIRLPALRRVSILVLNDLDNTPLEDAEIFRFLRPLACTDRDGRAEIEIATSSEKLRLQRHGYFDEEAYVHPTALQTVTMSPLAPIVGRVLHPDGRAAQGAWVARSDALASAVVTDARGAFVLDGTESARQVSVEAIWYDSERVWVGRNQHDAPPLTVTLLRRQTSRVERIRESPHRDPDDELLTIRVVDPAGAPVPKFAWEFRFGPRNKRPSRATPLWENYGSEFDPGVAMVWRPKGFEGYVEIQAPEDSWGRALPLAGAVVEVGGSETEIEVRLAGSHTVRGRVIDESGRPVPGVLVAVQRWRDVQRGTSIGTSARSRSRSDGRFEIEGVAGDDGLRIVVSPGSAFVMPEPIPWTGRDKEIEVRLGRGVRPSLEIVADEGAPVADARVTILCESTSGLRETMSARSDERGRLVLDALDPAATYLLLVSPPQNTLHHARIPAWTPRDERVVLARQVTLTGRITSKGGQPLQGLVLVRDPSSMTRTSETGQFQFTTRAGPIRISASAEGHVGPELTIEAHVDLPPIEFVLQPVHDLTLRIVGPGPWPEMVYVLRNGELVRWSRVQGDGSARIAELDPTRPFELWAPPSMNGGRYVLEQLAGFGPEEHRIETRQGGVIRVRPRVPMGREVKGVRARLKGREVDGVALPDGGYEVRGVPDGRWTVVVDLRLRPWEIDEEWIGQGEASPGDSVDIEVRRAY